MPTINELPEADLAGFVLLRQMNADGVRALHDSLEQAEGYVTTAELVPRIADVLAGSRDDARKVRDALMGLVAQKELRPAYRDEWAVAVARYPGLGVPEDEQEAFAARLNELSRSRALRIAYKALDVITQHERVFHDARVLTDVRPVFIEDADTAPSSAVIIEMLKIEFHRPDGERDACYFALDHADLLRLQEVIARGVTKTGSVRDVLNTAELTYWEYEEPDAASR